MISTANAKLRIVRRNRRILFIGGVFTVLYIIIGVKAVYLQVIEDAALSKRALQEYQRDITCTGRRGTIYDVKHRELVLSTDVVSIGAHPAKIEDKHKTAEAVAHELGTDQRSVYNRLMSRRPFVWIDRDVPPAAAASVRSLGYLGLEYFPSYCRVYPNRMLAAQVLGFSGVDGNGLEGIEYYYDDYLKGNPHQWRIIKDALGRIFEQHEAQACALGYEGKNLILTLDSTIQYITEKALKRAVEENNAKSGIAVVMVPATGEVRAMVNYPAFNPNSFSLFSKDTWRNRAITDPFEPGSTLKVFLVAAALESGKCSPEQMVYCEKGQFRIGGNVIHDTHPYENLTLREVVKYSSNIGAAKVAEIIGPETLYQTLVNFGFGEKTGIDCPGESGGSLRDWRQWKKIDNATIAFGQGVSVSAISLLTAVSAIANDGVLMKPRMVKAIIDKNGAVVKSFGPTEIRKVVSPETARVLQEMMRAATDPDGTGVNAVPPGYTVCGKTGTAQKINPDGTYRDCEYNGLFVGFALADSPRLAVLVVVNEPQRHHYGGVVAAPAFREIIHETFNYMGIPPLRESREGGA
jgi:cell division protein FtsI (penicillin-binding protein 3)